MTHINIEIKARSTKEKNNLIRKKLVELGADFRGLNRQVDTYFETKDGRLKLRESELENYLAFYNRENIAGQKKSEIILYDINNNKDALKNILEKTNGVLVVVDKQREIYFIDNVKFHLDYLEGLGYFMEIEAIDKTGEIGEKKLNEQCAKFQEIFDIKKEELLEKSYSDYLLELSDL